MIWPFGSSKLLEIGSTAPDFSLSDENGNTVRLSQYRGQQPVALVFYPMDETPGCRKQLCQLRDHWRSFAERNVALFGVNPAGPESHRKFKSRHNLPFPLLVDRGKRVAAQFGAGGLFVKRTVYGIDQEGKIIFAERGMPAPKKVLAALAAD